MGEGRTFTRGPAEAVLEHPDARAALETLIALGFGPAQVAEAMDRLVAHGQRRARMDSAARRLNRERDEILTLREQKMREG